MYLRWEPELISEGSEVQILLATGFKAFENVSWIS